MLHSTCTAQLAHTCCPKLPALLSSRHAAPSCLPPATAANATSLPSSSFHHHPHSTLSLPGDFARLGWLPALLIFAWFALMGVYSGTLYQRLSLRVPVAVVFDEIGRAAMGTPGSAMVYATIYMTIFCEPIIFHITCMETLRQVGSHCVTAVSDSYICATACCCVYLCIHLNTLSCGQRCTLCSCWQLSETEAAGGGSV
jgi:hypothetical protein